jgi:hypothetical protein
MAKPKSRVSPLTFALKGTNILIAGDKKKETQGVLELVYSGGKAELANVTVALIEIDEYETIDPKVTGKETTLAKFVGDVANKVFTTKSSEILTDKLADTAPYIKVSIGGKDPVKVKLPDAQDEGGLFELGVQVTCGKSTYRSTWRAYARHYTITPAEGPVLAFITGDDATADANHRYFTAAAAYWKQHADAVLLKDGMSLEEIVAFLAKHREGYGDYGEVNIVGHGSRLHAAVAIVKGGEPALRLKTLYQTLGVEGAQATDTAARRAQMANARKFAYTAAQLGLGAHSRIVFRACMIGHRADLLQAIRKHLFADGCTVYAPKYLQAYSTADFVTRQEVAPFEYFSEDFERHVPGSDSPDQASQEALMRPIFAAAHPKLSIDTEKGSYTAEVLPGTAPYTWLAWESRFYDFEGNGVKSDEQLATEIRQGFDAERSEDMLYTRWSQWRLDSISRDDVTDAAGRIVTSKNVWVTVVGADAVPQQSFVTPGPSDKLALGSGVRLGRPKPERPQDRPGGITLPAPSIADIHARLSTSGAPRFAIRAEEAAEGNPPNTFAVGDRSYQTFSGRVPMSFAIGPYSIELRRERRRRATAQLSWTLVFWQRALRKDDAKVAYEKRKLVIPYVSNSSHYGSSDDPTPTDEQLARLFE